MTETPERPAEAVTVPVDTLPPLPPPSRPSRLNQAAAWVAIVAGTVFVVGAVFFTGFILGRHGGHDGPGWGRDRDGGQFHQRMSPPMMPMGPGGPGMGPGNPGMGPGNPGMGPNTGPGPTSAPNTIPAPRP